MKIMKASAGSGKTYNLARSFVDLLLNSEDRYAYRHVLAVTFTNKATAEMKNRILSRLHDESRTNPKARQILTDILHDYSAFSISTIDKFFQQTLKAFSREIGQFADYQIELDRKSVISEAMDRILDSLTEDQKDLIGWIKASLQETVEKGEKFSIDSALYDIGMHLKSEGHREMAELYGIDDVEAFSKERLSGISKSCRAAISEFEKRSESLGFTKRTGENGPLKEPGVRERKKNPELSELFDTSYANYVTAFSIESLVFSLGLAGEFYKQFDAILQEKNVMCLDESNTILKGIIDGSDAPFIYEKLGVRYENFLLDEFQDTSNIQWENFLPLLKDSEARGGRNLVVGDVKQSIYRFRNSEWKLLGQTINEQFPDAGTEVLRDNWRSCRNIVEFNNSFFLNAASKLGVTMYGDVAQGVKTKDTAQGGQVRVSFTDDIPSAVIASVNAAREMHAQWGDIAVLVRNNDEGSDLASSLIGQGIPVLSDDSLKLKSSLTVRRLASLLNHIDNPSDTVGSFLAEELEVTYPDNFHSLLDLCEGFLRQLRARNPEEYDGEALFVNSFMDYLRSWVEVNGNDLRKFLAHWNEDEKSCISSPASSDAVRIITIHKSKGLEFPYLIFPYAEKVDFYRHGVHWCHLDTRGSGLPESLDGIYPVDLTERAGKSLFSKDYEDERGKQIVDNINIFYVALTRAEKTLHIISAPPTATFVKSLDAGTPDYKRFTDILYQFVSRMDEWCAGDPYDFSLMPRESGPGVLPFPCSAVSIALGDRLKPSADAMDFFGEDGQTGYAASARLSGIVLHGILSCVNVPEDLAPAISSAVTDGQLDRDQAAEAERLLSERISAHLGWFSHEGRNEVSIIGADGQEHRPDRVVLSDDGSVTVIDYKFGEPHRSHQRQVSRYMDLYRQMGFGPVSGAVWYVRDDSVVRVAE